MGSGPDPQKSLFCQFHLLPGFGGIGVLSFHFRNGKPMQTGPEGRDGQGVDQNVGNSKILIKVLLLDASKSKVRIRVFFINRTPAKIRL